MNQNHPGQDGKRKVKNPERFKPSYKLSAFQNDYLPILRREDTLEFFSWGFIQPTVMDDKESIEIKHMTANAKCETVFEKKLYMEAIHEKRCLILLDGFFEWRHEFKKKYPHYIYHATDPILHIGGIWNEWKNPFTGEIKETVSLITTEANPTMAIIHNQKKRMPLIFDAEAALNWLDDSLNEKQIKDLMKPYADHKMAYHTIGKQLDADSISTILPVHYPELSNEQLGLFE